ncbi:MAG: hypothetical protein AAF423_12660 [Pseudomonadota bacterium]
MAGVDSADWYNSAALVPFGIFGCMLVLAFVLLGIAIRDGGARQALTAVGIGYSRSELIRLSCICTILFFYIFGLVPRVDFVIASSLMMTCLIWGFHKQDRNAMLIGTATISSAALYALVMHFPRSQWTKPHDDDWIALAAFLLLTTIMIFKERRKGKLSTVTKLTPVISVLAPLILVLAMAFGFRQNVPNRTGLIFSHMEYHYYVSLRPLWRSKN